MTTSPTPMPPLAPTDLSRYATDADRQLASIDTLREQMREQFHTYQELQQLTPADRDALFGMLLDAQRGDLSVLHAVRELVYDELPVDMEEFILGSRYLGLRGLINAEKLDLLIRSDAPQVREVNVAAGSGSGKAVHLDTPIPTPCGWTTMGDVRVGDRIFDERGRACRVVACSAVEQRDAFRLTFDDGTSIVAADTHEWAVLPELTRRKFGPSRRFGSLVDWRTRWDMAEIRTTQALAQEVRRGGRRDALNWAIPTCAPLEGPDNIGGLPPYTLGVWLGNGTGVNPSVTLRRSLAPAMVGRMQSEGMQLRERLSASRDQSVLYGLLEALPLFRLDGLFAEKHIPPRYLRASVSVRLALLQGLMDTDGCQGRSEGYAGIELTDVRLARGVAELLRTFGWKVYESRKRAKLEGRDYGWCYRMYFRPDLPVYSARPSLTGEMVPGQAQKRTVRYITDIVPVGPMRVRCLQVDSPSHLYLVGEGLIPTHNSFVVSIAMAREVYQLLCLKKPDMFYTLGPGSRIAVINLSVSKEQARDVIFAEFTARVSSSPWFARFQTQRLTSRARFPKRIYVFSGGSSATAYYGYHTKFGSLDEASFLMDRAERSVAAELVEALSKSLNTRFPLAWKLWVISTLRSADDFLYQTIEEIKDTGIRLV